MHVLKISWLDGKGDVGLGKNYWWVVLPIDGEGDVVLNMTNSTRFSGY